ncbi:LytTR family DNA-binding domain-containing protein [Geobacter sp. AOG2]|uniref:LytR/AlgR family response regulator transcription factor n=1 Tax=Geobacter sp. AOG2 TaxID=1566347 RepID=UPI001CC3BBF3|nr:LytTR family DNA-binding domain-containing protein [Geobacter sp. AOG2]GFE62094.1 histidine kinase [Geobacter sp. AOG2]
MSRTLISMIEQMEPGVVVLNGDLTVSSISSMIFLIFGNVPRERLFEGDLLGLHREDVRTKVAETLRLAHQARRHIPLSLKIISTEGQDRYLVVKLFSLAEREPADDKICALFYDITPLILAERKLIRLPVTLRGEIHLLKPEEIVFLKADNIYASICTESGEYHCDMSLGAIEKRLSGEMFFRIHRSYLVNIAKVRKVHRERHECSVEVGSGEVRLPVSRDKLQDFLVEIGLK